MGRKKKRILRQVFPDIVYKNLDVEKFINIITISGKKTIARNILYKAFNYIKNKYNKDPILIFSLALDNSAPMIEIKSKKISGIVHNIPCEIRNYRRKSLSMRWIKKFSKIRKEKSMFLKLAHELLDASKKKGESVKKRNATHKLAISNKNYFRK